MNRPLLKIFQIVWRTTKWRVDWQRSLRLGRSIVASLGEDIGDHPLFAIENSQIDLPYMNDNLEWYYMLCRPQVVILDVVVFGRLTLLPPMLLFRINEGVENAKNRLYK